MAVISKTIVAAALAGLLAISTPAMAADPSNTRYEEGDDVAVLFDLVILRPFGLVVTAAGTAIYVAVSPITAITGNLKKSFAVLVAAPAAYTFKRDLGESRM